jgi:tetratricopeptide (TPR) repeat protein
VDNNYFEGLAMMKQGKFQRALALFAGVWKKVPGHPGVGQNFPIALEGLKKSGDETYQKGRFEDAGKRWTAAVRLLSHPALKGRSVDFSKRDVNGKIDKLSEFLMEKGLSEYRQGQLQDAIATWRQILAYDPDHEEATKSVKTATTQLKNLKKITPPAGGK